MLFDRTLLRDKATYGADTDKFYPERFLAQGMKDPNPAFGYGRRYTKRFDIYVCFKLMLSFIRNRICAGRYFADNSVYMAIASILSVFDIAPSRDSTGQVIPVEAAFQSGFLS